MAYSVLTDQPFMMSTRDDSGALLAGMHSYSAQEMRRMLLDAFGPGDGILPGDGAVTASGEPDDYVHVAPMRYRITGTDLGGVIAQGIYFGRLSGQADVQVYPADTALDRIDLLVVQIVDADVPSIGGTERIGQVTTIEGDLPSPGQDPVAPALPTSCLEIAQIYVPHGSTTVIQQTNISGSAPLATIQTPGLQVAEGSFKQSAVPLVDVKGVGVPRVLWRADSSGNADAKITSGTVTPVTFDNIPQIYRHLKIRWGLAWSNNTEYANFQWRANGSASAVYHDRVWNYSGGGSYSNGDSGATQGWLGDANTVGQYGDLTFGEGDLFDYTNAIKHVIHYRYTRNDGAFGGSNGLVAGGGSSEYPVAAAISSLSFFPAASGAGAGAPQWSNYCWIEVVGEP